MTCNDLEGKHNIVYVTTGCHISILHVINQVNKPFGLPVIETCHYLDEHTSFFFWKPKIMSEGPILVDLDVLITIIFSFLKWDKNQSYSLLNVAIQAIYDTIRAKIWPNIKIVDQSFLF